MSCANWPLAPMSKTFMRPQDSMFIAPNWCSLLDTY
jgi:hypothetical protein